MSNKDPHRYDDIINLSHHVSKTHKHMAVIDRAAQFAPFAALTGHGDAINETARLTDQRIELDENSKQEINNKLISIIENIKQNSKVNITYFIPDNKKSGGVYLTKIYNVNKFDMYQRRLIMEDETVIYIDDIIAIDSIN